MALSKLTSLRPGPERPFRGDVQSLWISGHASDASADILVALCAQHGEVVGRRMGEMRAEDPIQIAVIGMTDGNAAAAAAIDGLTIGSRTLSASIFRERVVTHPDDVWHEAGE